MPNLSPDPSGHERPQSLGDILRRKLDELAAAQAAGLPIPVSPCREALLAALQRGQK